MCVYHCMCNSEACPPRPYPIHRLQQALLQLTLILVHRQLIGSFADPRLAYHFVHVLAGQSLDTLF